MYMTIFARAADIWRGVRGDCLDVIALGQITDRSRNCQRASVFLAVPDRVLQVLAPIMTESQGPPLTTATWTILFAEIIKARIIGITRSNMFCLIGALS